MNFVKQEIKPKIIGIIDIGTYKIRVGICKIINRDVELIGYGEKRQDEDFIVMQEIQNLKGVTENIALAIKKAEKDGNIEVNDIIINIPTTNIFFEFSQINHIRENLTKQIDDKELYEIMTIIESLALKKHFREINDNSGFKKNDLKLLLSNISKIKNDKIETKVLLGTNPLEVNISLLNVFIAESKLETISYIKRAIGKNIINIIPSEFAITGLFKEEKDVVIIDIGNSHTSIIVKKEDNILGAKKLAFGINDLIKHIRKNYNLPKNEIIRTIDMDRFQAEKASFLQIFKDVLTITLEEILGKKICPNKFFMVGGGANKFIKNFLKETNLNIGDFKIVGNITFVNPKIDFLQDKIENNEDWLDNVKSNVNIYAMIKTTLDFIKKDKNKIEKVLKQVIHDLEA